MDIAALAAELASGHPGTGAYDADAVTAAARLNAVNRTRLRSAMSGDEVFKATDTTEFAGLTDHKQLIWLAFCGRDSIDPTATSNVALVNWVFGAGSDTLAALAAARVEAISRAVELGFGEVTAGDVQRARA